jgi:hypothetical protein
LAEQTRQWKQYPLAEASHPPETKFIDITGQEHDTPIPKGPEYFKLLARYINISRPRKQDMAMLGMLETLGIAHGRKFEPDERMQEILADAAEVGLNNPWFRTPNYLVIDQRTRFAYEAIGAADAMVLQVPGQRKIDASPFSWYWPFV